MECFYMKELIIDNNLLIIKVKMSAETIYNIISSIRVSRIKLGKVSLQ